MLQTLLKKFKKLVLLCNSYGIPLPLVRDPKTKIGSVSLTLVFVSSLMVIIGLVGKWSGKLGIIDIDNAMTFFYASSFLYFGRNLKTGALVQDENQAAESEDKPPAK